MKKTLAMILAIMMLLACVPAMAEGIENPYEEYGVEIYTDENGEQMYNYDSLAGVGATVLLNGCQDSTDTLLAAWQFAQWQPVLNSQQWLLSKQWQAQLPMLLPL